MNEHIDQTCADAPCARPDAPVCGEGAEKQTLGVRTPERGVQGLTIVLPLPPRECSANFGGTLRARIRGKMDAKQWARYATLEALGTVRVEWPRVTATAAFTFPVRRTRDDDGLVHILKPYRDQIAAIICGGADAGWTWAAMPTVAIGPNEGVTITITPIAEGE